MYIQVMKFFFEDCKNPLLWLTYDVISTKVKIRKASIVKIQVQQYKASRQLPARRNYVTRVAPLREEFSSLGSHGQHIVICLLWLGIQSPLWAVHKYILNCS